MLTLNLSLVASSLARLGSVHGALRHQFWTPSRLGVGGWRVEPEDTSMKLEVGHAGLVRGFRDVAEVVAGLLHWAEQEGWILRLGE